MINSRIAFIWTTGVAILYGSLRVEAQPLRESFEGAGYTVGVNVSGLNGGTGFGGQWTEGGGASQFDKIAAGSLSYPLFPSSGNSVKSVPPSDYYSAPLRIINPISGADGTSLWVGYLFRKDSDNTLGAPVDADYFGLTLYGTASPEALFIGDSGESSTFALGTAGTASAGSELSTTAVTVGNTVFLAAKINFQAGAENVQLFVNPDISAGEPKTPSATKTNLDLGNITSLGFLAGYDGVYSYDEIRAGPTFAAIAGLPVLPDVKISIAKRADGSVEITHDGTLESRPAANSGSWSEVSGPNPLVIPEAQLEKSRFYRARSP